MNGVTELTAKIIGPVLATNLAPGGTPLESYVSIRRFIDRHLTSPALSVDMIATSFGLSRATLYRLFEPVGGIATYIRKQKLDRAFQEITAASRSNGRVGPIAYRLGFKNFSAFSRAFRSAYGVSPAEAREKALHQLPSPLLTSDVVEGDSLGRLLIEADGARRTTSI